jgi:putative tryptophan/tyrosine transport system substrate-binding protein
VTLRVVALIVALAVLAAPLIAEAEGQRAARIPRIGYLGGGNSPIHDEFRRQLRDHGYTEGRNIVVEYRWYEGRLDRAREQAAELVRLGVDVLVATGPQGFLAAKEATAPSNRIPIVMAGVSDPVGFGFVASLARPGGHITGLSWDVGPEPMSGKLLQLLKEAAPKAARVAALWNPDSRGAVPYVTALENTGRSLGVKLQPVEVRHSAEFHSAFRRMVEEKIDAVVVLADPLTVPNSKEIVRLAAINRLPAIYMLGLFVTDGGLMSYGVNMAEHFGRTAVYVDKILKGAKPADLPVEQPAKFELAVNMRTAKALGLTIPPSILVRADQVIE